MAHILIIGAWFYYGIGKIDLPLADYNLSIEKDSNYALSYYDRGLIYENQKRLAEAEADFRMTLKLNPGYDRAIKELQNMGLAP